MKASFLCLKSIDGEFRKGFVYTGEIEDNITIILAEDGDYFDFYNSEWLQYFERVETLREASGLDIKAW